MTLKIMALAAAATTLMIAGSAEAAVNVYSSEINFLAARSDLTKSSVSATLPVRLGANGSMDATIGAATISSATLLSLRECGNRQGICLMSSILSDAAAAVTCDNAGIGVNDPLRSACMYDVRIAEQPTLTDFFVASSAIGLLVDVYHAHGNATIDYVVNGQQGTTTFNRFGFIGFSGDQPLDITLTSSSALFIRTVYTGAAISAIPEPTTWVMMLLGFGMLGGGARYRRRSVKVSIT